MKKTRFLGFLLLALSLGFVSCSNDDEDDVEVKTTHVTFKNNSASTVVVYACGYNIVSELDESFQSDGAVWSSFALALMGQGVEIEAGESFKFDLADAYDRYVESCEVMEIEPSPYSEVSSLDSIGADNKMYYAVYQATNDYVDGDDDEIELGLSLVWNPKDAFLSTEFGKEISIDVSSDYFFLKMTNKGYSDLPSFFVEGNDDNDWSYNFLIPADNKTYDLGYYYADRGMTIGFELNNQQNISVVEGNQFTFDGSENYVLELENTNYKSGAFSVYSSSVKADEQTILPRAADKNEKKILYQK